MKTILVLVMAGFIVSCGDGDRTKTDSDVKTDRDTMVTNNAQAMNPDDAALLRESMQENYRELRMADLALRKSSNSEVKKIAEMLRTDHAATEKNIMSLATQKSVALSAPDSMPVLKDIDDMGAKNAIAFDKDWCREMSNAHEKKIKKFERASSTVMDADLRNWINDMIPTLKTHYDALEACKKKL
jgi:putative membrane protein